MIEIFENISENTKKRLKEYADAALLLNDPFKMAKLLADYTKNCCNEEEQEFADFYFNMRLEELKDNI